MIRETNPDAVFTALAHPTRREVLRLVSERGPTSATTLERELPVTQQAIVKHLVVLGPTARYWRCSARMTLARRPRRAC